MAGSGDVGLISLRHGADEMLRRYAGQVGYRIAPAQRGRGYAARALRALMPVARAAGWEGPWITCAPDNVASRRTLEKAGATFVETVALPTQSDLYARGQRHVCRYRLAL